MQDKISKCFVLKVVKFHQINLKLNWI